MILVVGIARLALSLGGTPDALARWVSITVVMWIGIVYFAIRVHTTGFGSYRQLLPIYFLQSLVGWLGGSLVLFVTRRVTRDKSPG